MNTMNTKETPIELNNWAINTRTVYDPPEFARLTGDVKCHPDFANGQRVSPSLPLKDWNPDNHTFRSYSGKLYQLGNPHPEYEAVYPDAKFRFITSCFGVNVLD